VAFRTTVDFPQHATHESSIGMPIAAAVKTANVVTEPAAYK
jgi:hypothetical protein